MCLFEGDVRTFLANSKKIIQKIFDGVLFVQQKQSEVMKTQQQAVYTGSGQPSHIVAALFSPLSLYQVLCTKENPIRPHSTLQGTL